MSSYRSVRRLALAWSSVLAAIFMGCATPATGREPGVETGDGSESEVASASTFTTCGSCPFGSFATRLFCDTFSCGNTCTPGFSTNASECTTPPSCGSFNKCGASCPSGFSTNRLFCDTFNCGNTCTSGFSNNAATCTSISQPTCCQTCSGFPVGGTNDRGAFNGQHFVELFFTSFTSGNPSIGTASQAACTCAVSFTIGQIFCNGSPTPATVTFSSTTQINIAIPTSPVSRNCVAFSSSTNTQFIRFNFTTPPD